MRKTLVTLLVLVMALGFAGTALAAGSQVAPVPFNDIAGNKNEASLTAMAALGIMSGYSGIGGPVRPDANITRAEFAKMIVGALGKASTATGLQAVKPTFKDHIKITLIEMLRIFRTIDGVIGRRILSQKTISKSEKSIDNLLISGILLPVKIGTLSTNL